jgi:hypothetical protein
MSAAQVRPRREKVDTYPDNCITEGDTPHGYWWRNRHPKDQPGVAMTMTTALCVAFEIADAEARKTGKTYLVASTPQPALALYVFACDHPDARNPAINIMVERTPAGERIRWPRPCSTTRH